MKKIICLSLAMLFSVSAMAAEMETYVNYDTGEVTVSGEIDEAAFNRMISVTVSDSDTQYYVNTVETDADGSYRFTMQMPQSAETGNYKIVINALGKSEAVSDEFYFAKKSDIDNLLGIINNASSVSEILNSMESSIDVLNIPQSWYGKLDSNGKNAVAEALYTSKPYTEIGMATTAAYNELAVQSFRCADSADAVKSALDYFASVYNINAQTAECYELYNKLGSKTNAHSIMASYDCTDAEDVIKAYNESVFLAAVNAAGDPLTIRSLFSEYRSVIPFSLDTYDKSDEEKTVTYLYKCSEFNSMSALQTAISTAYTQQNTSQNSGGSSGGSSGGGGGGSSTSSSGMIMGAPVATAIPKTDTDALPAAPEDDTELQSFSDLIDAEWAREAIEYLAEKKIVAGTGDNMFEPNAPLTREQFVLMIVNAFSMADPDASCEFEDMPQSHWAYNAVASACSREIILGISDDEFGTGMKITRQDMAVIAYRAAEKAGYEFGSGVQLSFTDEADISDYAKESVFAMSAAGIINGYDDLRFAPWDTATRAEAAKIIYSMIR